MLGLAADARRVGALFLEYQAKAGMAGIAVGGRRRGRDEKGHLARVRVMSGSGAGGRHVMRCEVM